MQDGKAALAHGHAGVWLLDWLPSKGAAPTATSYYAVAQDGSRLPAW